MEKLEEEQCDQDTPPVDAESVNTDNGGAAFDEKAVLSLTEGADDEASAAATEDPSSRKWRRGRRNRKAGDHHQFSGRADRHRQWKCKPYPRMTWTERREMQANRRRDRLQASGQAMAPFNTTQFLMEQHEPLPIGASGDVQPFFNDKDSYGANRSSGSLTEDSSSVADLDDAVELLFLEKEFTEEYESFQAERLLTLSKDELIREYVELEKKLERIQRSHGTSRSHGDERRFADDLKRLANENARLSEENAQLRVALATVQRLSSEALSTSPDVIRSDR